MSETEARAARLHEFDRQVRNLLHKGYPAIAGVEAEEFVRYIEPLKERLHDLAVPEQESEEERIPFVIVMKKEMVTADRAMPLVKAKNREGFSVMDAKDIQRFEPIEGVRLPHGTAYLLADIDTGKETRNITPDAAMKIIDAERRSPLTIEEGVALVTHYPEILKKNNGFSLPGSRCGDRRVTALWISEGRPKLGWCWAGNPHTWLGSASCGSRVGL